jgi:hypothetical protein
MWFQTCGNAGVEEVRSPAAAASYMAKHLPIGKADWWMSRELRNERVKRFRVEHGTESSAALLASRQVRARTGSRDAIRRGVPLALADAQCAPRLGPVRECSSRFVCACVRARAPPFARLGARDLPRRASEAWRQTTALMPAEGDVALSLQVAE